MNYIQRLTMVSFFFAGMISSANAEEYRHESVHEHGGGQLDVAIEGEKLNIDLSVPAMNILGFEHAAETDADQKALKDAVAKLEDVANLFIPNADAQCTLKNHQIESALLESDAHNEEKHHDEDHQDGSHSDFDARYEFLCKSPSALTQIDVHIFEQFPGNENLQVQWVHEQAQGGDTLTKDHRIIKVH